MTNAVNFSTALRTPSSSTPALRRSTAFKRQNLRPTHRCCSLSLTPISSFSLRHGEETLFEARDVGVEEHEQVVAERNILRDQLARRNEEIKKLKAVVDSALKELSNVVTRLKEVCPSNEEEDGKKKKIAQQLISPEVKSANKCEPQKVEPKTPEVRATGKRRNDIWGRSSGDDSLPPSKKSHLSRSTGLSFP
ncbi:uncharacterized protein LOC116124903 [Pistacia vera]|uniref:uncharacterized protein LOC116124903 n=1 Tax=Pistacia vera TaxID=55513 RepID=UPI001263D819|nr:uncharacterized protein LOC116124903 [Pistacia vera]